MSKRNGNVTRWATDTFYRLEWFSAKDREFHQVESIAHGKRSLAEIRKICGKALKKDEEVIVRIEITGYDKRLYAMPDHQFFAQAKVISEEHINKTGNDQP